MPSNGAAFMKEASYRNVVDNGFWQAIQQKFCTTSDCKYDWRELNSCCGANLGKASLNTNDDGPTVFDEH